MTNCRLAEVFSGIAGGQWPDPDGLVEVVPAPVGWRGAICAFTAHTIVAAPMPRAEVMSRFPSEDLGAPLSAAFQTWLSAALGAPAGVLDALLVAVGNGKGKGALREASVRDHPRVRRAQRYRDELSVWSPPAGDAVVCLGRGLARRWEIAVEVDAPARGRGVGRACISDALGLLPGGDPVFAQVSPGNAASMRAFIASGFVPVGSEVLFGRSAPEPGD